MNFWMILIAAQVIVAIIAFASGTRQDPRFQDEKLEFRD
jgi:DNA-binding transcriptional regulator of glucitol operon